MAAAADIEQMNKLRKSLGLPLLNVSGSQPPSTSEGPTFKSHSASDDDSDQDFDREVASTLETREAAGFANWKQIQDDEKKRVQREKRKKELQKARDVIPLSSSRPIGDCMSRIALTNDDDAS